MPKQIRMPKLSDTMEEGTLLAWRKSVGDSISRGDILAEIETDKADMEFESYTEGTIHALLVDPGATVPVGTLIAVVLLPGESEEDVGEPSEQTVAAPAAAAAPAAPRGVVEPDSPTRAAAPTPARGVLPGVVGGERVIPPIFDEDRVRATPRARKLAEERSIDLSEVEGSGPWKAILLSDLERYLNELEATPADEDGIRATPVASAMAADLGLDLEAVKGSGPGGRVTKSDVLAHVKSEKDRQQEREAELFRGALQLSQKRKALIRNMVRSKEEAPHFYVEMDVQTDQLKEVRDRVNKTQDHTRLTYTHLMLKACALALERFPEVNATFRSADQQIGLYEAINIAIAVDVQDELVAPTVKDCQGKSVFQLAEDANELIQRARMRKLKPDDYADGTFTISNLGMFGVDRFYAIITPPQSSTLSVGSIKPRPIVRDGQVVIGTMTTLGLSVDHRVLDGVKAAQFLAELRRLLEDPEELVRDDSSFGR